MNLSNAQLTLTEWRRYCAASDAAAAAAETAAAAEAEALQLLQEARRLKRKARRERRLATIFENCAADVQVIAQSRSHVSRKNVIHCE